VVKVLVNCRLLFPVLQGGALRFVPRLILFLVKITTMWENGSQLDRRGIRRMEIEPRYEKR
jgi:hypothetical protein